MRIEYEAETVTTRMEMADGYPLMRIISID
jgi:hypothetical protein